MLVYFMVPCSGSQQCVQLFSEHKGRWDSASAVMKTVVHEKKGDKHLSVIQVSEMCTKQKYKQWIVRSRTRDSAEKKSGTRGLGLDGIRISLRWMSDFVRWKRGEGHFMLRKENAQGREGAKVKSTWHLGEYQEVRWSKIEECTSLPLSFLSPFLLPSLFSFLPLSLPLSLNSFFPSNF